MKIYISIPITGEDYELQRKHANEVAETLSQEGYEVVTPFDVNPSLNVSYNEAMGKCVTALLDCDAIYLCNGFENSKGCNAELRVALVYRKKIITER